MQDINEYIKLNREFRRSHLNLNDSCIERGGGSANFRGLLAHVLNTTIPSGSKIYLCHACNNGKCCNPTHLYWGTPTDNHLDQVESGTWKSMSARTLEKYGEKKFREIVKNAGKANKNKVSRNSLSNDELTRRIAIIDKYIPFIRGTFGKCAAEIGITHTSLRRFVNTYYVSR